MRADIHDGQEQKLHTGRIHVRKTNLTISKASCDARPVHTFGLGSDGSLLFTKVLGPGEQAKASPRLHAKVRLQAEPKRPHLPAGTDFVTRRGTGNDGSARPNAARHRPSLQ